MSLDGDSIVNRLTLTGFSSLTEEEQQWVIKMTRQRDPVWDERRQEAFLTPSLFSCLNGKAWFIVQLL